MKKIQLALLCISLSPICYSQVAGDIRVQYYTAPNFIQTTFRTPPSGVPSVGYHDGSLGGWGYVPWGDSLTKVSGKMEANWTYLVGKPSSLSSFVNDMGYIIMADVLPMMGMKENSIPSGSSNQYIRGDKVLAQFPANVSYFNNDSGYLLPSDLAPYATQASVTSSLSLYATNMSLYSVIMTKFNNPSGTTSEYLRGNGSVAPFPTNLSSFSNGPGYITGINSGMIATALGFSPLSAEVDGSTTNEIELPNMSGQSAKILSNNGTSATWVDGPPPRSFASPSRALVSTTSSTGFQVSSTRDAFVAYEGAFQTTSTIGGPSAITVFLEIANTNSTTPGDWTIISQQTNSSTITLAVALQSVDVEPWSFSRIIPAGKYVRIRYGSVTGTAAATINASQQETLL